MLGDLREPYIFKSQKPKDKVLILPEKEIFLLKSMGSYILLQL